MIDNVSLVWVVPYHRALAYLSVMAWLGSALFAEQNVQIGEECSSIQLTAQCVRQPNVITGRSPIDFLVIPKNVLAALSVARLNSAPHRERRKGWLHYSRQLDIPKQPIWLACGDGWLHSPTSWSGEQFLKRNKMIAMIQNSVANNQQEYFSPCNPWTDNLIKDFHMLLGARRRDFVDWKSLSFQRDMWLSNGDINPCSSLQLASRCGIWC